METPWLRHVIAGATVGVLTIGLGIWLSRVEKRAGLRRFGWVALVAVMAESLLGLQTAPLPLAVRVSHAFLAQLLFSATVAIAVPTSGGWRRRREPIHEQFLQRDLFSLHTSARTFDRNPAAGWRMLRRHGYAFAKEQSSHLDLYPPLSGPGFFNPGPESQGSRTLRYSLGLRTVNQASTARRRD